MTVQAYDSGNPVHEVTLDHIEQAKCCAGTSTQHKSSPHPIPGIELHPSTCHCPPALRIGGVLADVIAESEYKADR